MSKFCVKCQHKKLIGCFCKGKLLCFCICKFKEKETKSENGAL